ncbi:MAG: 6-bladed beta-propeller, partial [Bacteroidota bacterium]
VINPIAIKEQIITFDVHSGSKDNFLKSCTKQSLIPLETTVASPVGKAVKLVVRNSKFYFLDRQDYTVKVFGFDGKFIRNIANGEGPNSYFLLTDIAFNRYTGDLELLTPQGEVIAYDEKSNSYKKIFNLPIKSVSFFANIDNDLIAIYSEFSTERLFIYSRHQDRIVNIKMPNLDEESKNGEVFQTLI